jgi:Na+-transporting NADH:ubiquinone oxidoreductase subunit F
MYEVFIAVAVCCGITTGLTVIILIVNATVGNYGECELDINDGAKKLKVEGGETLLATLNSEGIFIPSACGGKGSCGLCKLKVHAGAGEALATELPWLTPEEQASNVRLSCQVKIKNDLKIEIPEEYFLIKEFKAKVTSIRDLTHDIKEVTVALIEPPKVDFKAGQFMQIKVPKYELSAEEVYRAYSISSRPSEHHLLEFEIRLVPNGICTSYVHMFLSEGDDIIINGPYGDFFLSDTDREVVCIAGGSGMAPIKSILLDMKDRGINRRTRYFFGASSRKDLFLLDKMKQLEEDLPNFQFIPALSSPEPEDNWEGDTGLITDVLAKHLENGDNVEAYLCGSPGMINACVKVLTDKGIPEELIFYDKFA